MDILDLPKKVVHRGKEQEVKIPLCFHVCCYLKIVFSLQNQREKVISAQRYSLEIQSTDQRKFREEPAIESILSLVMEGIVSTVEMTENRNIANEENSDKVVKKAANRRRQEKRR